VATRTARLNQLRACFREFGILNLSGVQRGIPATRETLTKIDSGMPDVLCPFVIEMLQDIEELGQRTARAERALRELTHEDAVVQQLLRIPAIGLLTASALRAIVVDARRFPPRGTSRRGLVSLPANTPLASGDVWAASASDETCT
jgi:transposase